MTRHFFTVQKYNGMHAEKSSVIAVCRIVDLKVKRGALRLIRHIYEK